MVTDLQNERRFGQPRTDAERVAAHYGISLEEAKRWLQIHSAEELLPERGYGLTGNEVPPECPSCWPFLIVGLVFGGILGTGFAMILQKGERG